MQPTGSEGEGSEGEAAEPYVAQGEQREAGDKGGVNGKKQDQKAEEMNKTKAERKHSPLGRVSGKLRRQGTEAPGGDVPHAPICTPHHDTCAPHRSHPSPPALQGPEHMTLRP